MNDDRQKLIVEIAGLAGLVSTYPPQFQAHIQDMARDLVADPEFYDYFVQSLNQQRDTVGPVSDKVRREELAITGAGGTFFQIMTQMLAPLADKAETRRKLGTIIDILCAEIVHRRAWDETMNRNPHTLEFLKRGLG